MTSSRPCTILFTDLVGSTDVGFAQQSSTRWKPEETSWRAV